MTTLPTESQPLPNFTLKDIGFCTAVAHDTRGSNPAIDKFHRRFLNRLLMVKEAGNSLHLRRQILLVEHTCEPVS